MGKSIKEYLAAFGKWGFIMAALLVGDIYGIIKSYYTSLTLPQWGWWLILVVILIVSPLIAFHKLRIQRDELLHQLDEIHNYQPKLDFSKAGEWQFHSEINGQQQPTYRAIQVWFINNPKLASEASIAKNVTATISFYNQSTKGKKEIFGCFTEAEVPDHATIMPPQHLKDLIEIWPPNNIPQKLLIALKYPGEVGAYAFARSNFFEVAQGGRSVDKELPKGIYYVKVKFTGTKVNQPPFWFMLTNPGSEGVLSISDPIEKPDLSKEGFEN